MQDDKEPSGKYRGILISTIHAAKGLGGFQGQMSDDCALSY